MPNFQKYLKGIKNAEVLEIGVAAGKSAERWLSFENVKHYTGIDPWLRYTKPQHKGFSTGIKVEHERNKLKNWNTQEKWDNVYESTKKRLEKYGDRVILLRGFSHEIMPTLKPNFYDIIYIDGNHATEYVKKDLELSLPLLKESGAILLDDYNLYRSVSSAVEQFLKEHKELKLKRPEKDVIKK